MLYEVIPTKIFRAGSGVLTYSSDQPLLPGHLVRIPLGRSTVNGIVLRPVHHVDFPTKPITKLLYPTPLPSHLLKSLLWLSDYYLCPLPTVASLILPNGVEKSRKKSSKQFCVPKPDLRSKNVYSCRLPAYDIFASQVRNDKIALDSSPAFSQVTSGKIVLNSPQQAALTQLHKISSPTKLLHGITGSGKTNLYLQLTQETLARHQSVILLVPEISLTSQLVQIFYSTFNLKITLIHSRQTESERHQIWEKLLTSDQPEIVIGPRSALFAPLKNLGLIIIDEAHESAYFQDNSPKYSALRLASFIASTAKISCVLGTATPLVTDYYLASARHAVVTLSQKAKSTAITPKITITNLTDRQNFTKNRYFSDQLLAAIGRNLDNHHQTLIFHNRRGSAPLTICEKCGWEALCPHCLLPLTLHADQTTLICHTCGHQSNLPHSCPDCHHPSLIHKGFGTKLLEQELKKLFKTAKIARFDADNKKQDSLDQLYDEVKNGDYQIIIGTQTIAKGLDLPKLATVGVVQADAGLSLPDFAAEERTFHLLTQVIGRVGRGHLDTAEVFIQTYQPDHPVIQNALTANYPDFAAYLLKKRRRQHLPPYLYLAKIAVTAKTEATVLKKITAAHQCLQKTNLILSPPTPAFHEQSSAGFIWQLTLRSTSRPALLAAIQQLPPKLLSDLRITLDPPSLL